VGRSRGVGNSKPVWLQSRFKVKSGIGIHEALSQGKKTYTVKESKLEIERGQHKDL